jgi:hypothetical protein
MDHPRSWRHTLFIDRIVVSDLTVLIALALVKLLVHVLTNGAYGFYRDELATIDDARYLAWGYVAYPPFAPFVARIAFELFGPSVDGLRLFPALAHAIAMVLAGLIAKELGGARPAQIIAALATAISPTVLNHGSLFEYVSFDYLWWVDRLPDRPPAEIGESPVVAGDRRGHRAGDDDPLYHAHAECGDCGGDSADPHAARSAQPVAVGRGGALAADLPA